MLRRSVKRKQITKMRMLIAIVVCLVSINAIAGGKNEFPKQISKELQLETLTPKHLENIDFKDQVAAIFTILTFTQELGIHQMNGATNNQVYLHKDGHKEAVYNGKGELVQDCLNQGSYNYYNPSQHPLGHFTADILPWLILGICREDKSTKKMRIDAYISDLKLGFQRAIKSQQGFDLPENFNFSGYGQSVAISFYLKALEVSKFNFATFVPENIHDQEQQKLFFEALENGIKKLLKNA